MKIAIIGNAPYKKPLGDYIDQMDEVIRFNAFCLSGHEQFVGSKTTVWCFTVNCWDRFTEPEDYRESWIVQRSGWTIAKAINNLKNPTILPWDFNATLQDELGFPPSTGIVGIYAAMKKWSEPVFLTGFNCFSPGKHHYYEAASRGRDNHNGTAERRLLLQWREQGKIEWDHSTKMF